MQEGDGVSEGLSARGRMSALFIGRRGQTIDAVQHLAQRIVFPEGPSPVRVVIDADGYRERRAESLQADAEEAAEEALRSGRPVELDPMPASERRIVHEYLRERGGWRRTARATSRSGASWSHRWATEGPATFHVKRIGMPWRRCAIGTG